MISEITQRFTELLAQGEGLVAGIPRERGNSAYWLGSEQIATYNAWLVSCANLLQVAAPRGSYFVTESTTLLAETQNPAGIMTTTVRKMHGVLKSGEAEWKAGLMRSVEYLVAAATFDDFLDHASDYHKGGKKTEAAVLASAVLEDTIKKICSKHSLPTTGKTVDPLIDDLAAAGVLTAVKAKRAKGYAGVRNHALHAEWENFDLKDVGQMIQGIRELVEEHL